MLILNSFRYGLVCDQARRVSLANKLKIYRLHSAAGFNNYEEERENFKDFKAPERFNFARDVIDNWAVNVADKSAFRFLKSSGTEICWSFKDLSALSKKAANVLVECGVIKGDVVLTIMGKCPEWWILYLAAIRIGAVFCPGTSMLKTEDVRYRIGTSLAKHVVCTKETFEAVSTAAQSSSGTISQIYVGSLDDKRTGWKCFNSMMMNSSSDHQCDDSLSDEPMSSFFTSGTTKMPKIVEHTHASYGYAHKITGKLWLDLTINDTIFSLSDPGWAKAAWSNFFASWHQGSCILVEEESKFNPERILDILTKYPISVFCAPPTAYRMMVQLDLSKYIFPKLRHCVSAGEPLNPEVYHQWYDMTGLTIHEGYGQSESTLQCAMFRCLPMKIGSIGKPAPGMDIKIIDKDSNEVERGTEGEIAIQVKPNFPVGLFKRYTRNAKETEASFIGNFYRTGDRASMDKDGYLWFVGRYDDVINSAGYRIGPFEVESVLIEHPAVVEAAVVASPDAKRGRESLHNFEQRFYGLSKR